MASATQATIRRTERRVTKFGTSSVKPKPDFIFMACTSASVSYREQLTREELVLTLLSGEIPKNRRAHLMTLLEEAPETLLKGLVEQVGEQSEKEEVERNLLKIADALKIPYRLRDWRKNP